MPTTNQPTLTQLLTELEAAVRTGNHARAVQLEQTITRRLVQESAERDAVERSLRELMQRLATGSPHVALVPPFEIKGIITRGGETKAVGSKDGVIYPVWFGTNRKPEGQGFSGARHHRVTRGRIDVHVPEAHRPGETGTAWLKRLLRFELRDDQLRIRQRAMLERDAFYAEVQQRLNDVRADNEAAHALFFIHGYNVTFDDAAIRAAQIGFDLNAAATAFFSWPSRGNARAYPVDEASIEASEHLITEFLTEFATRCQADKIHVIAHSMGNRGLLRALQRIAANAQTRDAIRFGQIFLAAPDIDRELFLGLAEVYTQRAERTTIYSSDGDKPVHLSAQLHGAPRVGYFAPYTVAEGIDTIAVPEFDVELLGQPYLDQYLGHSYFAQSKALLDDMKCLMAKDERPGNGERKQLRLTYHEDATPFWTLG